MPLETITLRGKGKHWRAEGAACVLGWLAYPPVTEQKKKNVKKAKAATEKARKNRVEFENYAALEWFRRMAMDDPDWASKPQLIPPALLLLSAKKISRVFKRAEKKIVSRALVAGDMLGQLLARHALEEGPIADHPLLKGVRFEVGVIVDNDFRATQPTRKVVEGENWRKATTTNIATSMAKSLSHPPEGWESIASKFTHKDVLNRVWSPSKSVAHLGLAFHGYLTTHHGNILPMTETLLEGNWLESVLLNAEGIRQMVVGIDSIEIEEADAVQLLLA